MPQTLQRPWTDRPASKQIRPSRVDTSAKPFSFEQELVSFGRWVDDPIWVPPEDSTEAMARTMVENTRLLSSKEQLWESVIDAHRSDVSQVREIDLEKASIRLPKGRFFVSVTEQKDFDQITDDIPACVQTRLDEFLAGPGQQRGVKVYYLKPLCVEYADQLFLTSREDLMSAIAKIQEEVYYDYRLRYWCGTPRRLAAFAANLALAAPRSVVNYFVQRRQRAIDEYEKKLEFKRRKTAYGAARTHRKFRTDGCSFDDMLELTTPLVREDVIEQYSIEQELSRAERERLLNMAAGTVPWFVTLSFAAVQLASLSITGIPPVLVCDPAFVAEMPGSDGVVLKIGHFDEVGGVTHVEI